VLIIIYIITAMALNVCLGYLGLLNLGYTAMFGVAGYITALLTIKAGMSEWIGLIAALGGVGLVSLAIGSVALRLKGVYFILVMVAFLGICAGTVLSASDITGGSSGLGRLPIPSIMGLEFSTTFKYYYLALVVLLICLYVVYRLVNSRVGRAMIAVRDNEDLANSQGINPFRYKMIAFITTGLLAATAGWLYAHFLRFIDPGILGFSILFDTTFAVLVGGAGTLGGPIVGSLFVVIVPQLLGKIPVDNIEAIRYVIFTVLLVVAIVRMPQGIWGWVKARYNYRYKMARFITLRDPYCLLDEDLVP
jgi:branched-chain amino acid transport system permease protein